MNTPDPPRGAAGLLRSRLRPALTAAVAAGLAGAIAVIAVYQRNPGLRVDMERGIPKSVTGMFPPEHGEGTFFAWSSGEVQLSLDQADRRAAWRCRADTVNWRPASAGPANVRVESGGRVLLDRRVTEPRATLAFDLPAEPSRAALDVTISVVPTFVPGPADRRALGLAFTGIRCDPAPGSHPWPSTAIVARATGAAAALGATIGLTGLTVAAAAGIAAFVAGAQAFSLASGGAAHSVVSPPVSLLVGLLALFCLGPVLAGGAVLRRPLSVPARLAVVLSGCAFYLKLLFLLHPDKTVVDALFHAHRLDWVLAGQFYFTQLSTSATPFPYAIGLYVVSAPFAALTSDHVTLLRVVVCASEALAVMLLYPAVVRAWNDRAVGVAVVALYSLIPLPYGIIGNANLTFAFSQSVALISMTAAASWLFARRRVLEVAGLTGIAALAFMSHVGTFTVLLPTLLILGLLHLGHGGQANRGPGRSILAAAALAVVLAFGLYYAHFGDVYRPYLADARAKLAVVLGTGEHAPALAPAPALPPGPAGAPERKASPLQLGIRGALDQTRGAFGLPMLGLALIGVWSLFRGRRTDRMVLALVAWGAAWILFLGWSAIRAVEPLYVQDAWEFIGRVEMATAPAVAVLAAYGALWAWRSRRLLRAVSVVLVILACVGGARALGAWIY